MKYNDLGFGTEIVPALPFGPDPPMSSEPERIALELWRERWAETPEESLARGGRIVALKDSR